VVVINKGEIVETGTHQELLDRKGFYHRLYISQFKGQEILEEQRSAFSYQPSAVSKQFQKADFRNFQKFRKSFSVP